MSTDNSRSNTIAWVIALVILLVIVVAVFGIDYLADPYYALAQLGLYALMVVLIGFRLRTCFRLVKAEGHSAYLYRVVFWVALTVLGMAAHGNEILRAQDRKYINMATSLGIYLALYAALEMIETLLRSAHDAKPASEVQEPMKEPGQTSQNP